LDPQDVARLFESGGNDEKDQEDEKDVDHWNDRHFGAFAVVAVKVHDEIRRWCWISGRRG
jgi:hypothetical protein